jgi:hypothetical protein
MGEEQSAETRGSIGNAGSTDRAYASKQPDPNAERKPSFWQRVFGKKSKPGEMPIEETQKTAKN